MTKDNLEIFLHGAEKPKVVTAAGSDVLHDVLVAAGVVNKDDKEKIYVFVGECDESLKHPHDEDNGEDVHEPVEIHLTLEVLDLHKHCHIHVHRCRQVAVEVNFGGKTKKHKFSPATTISTATEWARRKFHLDPASAAEYVLQICGTHEQPRSDVHIGELVKKNECSLCFDLVKEVTPQG